ncbi:MAG: PilW family protein [Burkholderiales bacterium]|nr:PilW family protein [Burkholderiales bacterium]
MSQALSHSHTRRSQGGFTLIELMIGAVLGMLTVIVIAQALISSEQSRRTISNGSNAELTGSLALYQLQRDIQMSGYGLTSNQAALGCPINAQYDTSGTPFTFTLAPVIITDGGGSVPDSIAITYGTSQGGSVPFRVTEVHPQTATSFIVEAALGVKAGDQLIAVPDAIDATHKCTLLAATNDTSAETTTLSQTRIPHTAPPSGNKWNQSSIYPADGYAPNSYLLNIGSLVQKTYSISSTYTLRSNVRNSTNGTASDLDLFEDVVNLQALYGKDTDSNGSVDKYDHVTPANANEWRQVVNVRLAIVTRGQYEKDEVTSTSPQWDIGSTITPDGETVSTCHGTSKCITLDVSSIANWKHYRYKVYSTSVPVRNILWNS